MMKFLLFRILLSTLWIYGAYSMPSNQTVLVDLSIDELVSGFRFQQIALSTTMLNTSRNLQLPEKLAAAEVQEANQREAKAFRGMNEARTPFIATTSRYNLGYIGRGYDIYLGNPLSDDGVIDQGFRLPVLDLPYSFKFTADGEYRVPDNVDIISETSARFGSSLFKVNKESDYQSMLKADASVNVQGGGWGVSASFSASFSYQKNKREIQKGEKTTLNIVSRAVVYRARMSETAKISKVDEMLERAVMALPMEDCEENAMQEMYINFIKEFGTHYTTEVVMGAKAVQQTTFMSSDVDKMESEGISASVAAQASYSGFGVSAGGGFSAGFGSNTDQRNRVASVNSEKYEYYLGGNPPAGDFSDGSTESLREWARSAAEKPVPIQYKLTSIDTLIKPSYFRRIGYGLFERRRCLRKALYTYCKRTVSASQCGPSSVPEVIGGSRRKRQAQESGVYQPLKYGDFMAFRNRNSSKYLALSKSTGYITGSVTKPLISVRTISDYDGLFQIYPSNGEEEKINTPVLYGEAFKLRAIKGDNMFLGRQFIEDVKNPSSAKLEDISERRDEKKTYPPNQVHDFSLFLKMDNEKFYMVSLQVDTGSWRCGVTMSYQINIEGKLGTHKITITTTCSCSYYSSQRSTCTGYKWFHSSSTFTDIGDITSVQFSGLQGRFVDWIKGIKIRTVQNRRVTKVQRTSLSCFGRNERIIFDDGSRESKSVDLDMYPAQFSLQSSIHPEATPVDPRDTVFIHVHSSVPRETFWGQQTSHLMTSYGSRIGIRERGPTTNAAIGECSDVIYPDNNLAKYHPYTSHCIISFEVTMMVKQIEIMTNKAGSYPFNITYLTQYTDTFMVIGSGSLSRTVNNTHYTFKLNTPQYMTALQLYIEKKDGYSTVVKEIMVIGCPSALIEKAPADTSDEQWTLHLKENEIQTYPYLNIVTKKANKTKLDELFLRIESEVTLPYENEFGPHQIECTVEPSYIEDYVMNANDIEGIKLENTQITVRGNRVKVTSTAKAMNQMIREMNMPALDGVINSALQSHSCSDQEGTVLALRQTQDANSESAWTTTAIVLATVLIIIVLAFVGLAVVWYRRRSKHGKDRAFLKTEEHPMVEKEDNVAENAMYGNTAYSSKLNVLESVDQSSPSIPPRQRRLT